MIEIPVIHKTDIFNVSKCSFDALALQIFRYQVVNNPVFAQFVQNIGVNPLQITRLEEIPFLPVSLFKTHPVYCSKQAPEAVFTSSGTTGMVTSSHAVAQLQLYETSFMLAFEQFYGPVQQYAILALLPAYLERSGSSLVYMANALIQQSGQSDSGFFLTAKGALEQVLQRREAAGAKSLLLGVSFALLDFAEQHALPLKHTIVAETGGMKGRRREITRMELHEQLCAAFGLQAIHSEYGMTELLSQAWSDGHGIYRYPPWMRVLVRAEDDPRALQTTGTGMLCIADLANLYSCSFIETQDIGHLHPDGSFEVLGRLDYSDVRGCSLLAL